MLLVYFSGYESTEAFFANHEALLIVRGLTVTTAAWVFIKHWEHAHKPPFGLLSVVDTRIDLNRREELGAQLLRSLCCIGPFLGRGAPAV